MQPGRNVFTPSELNREARLRLEAGFGRPWVEGEITNLSRAASGHLYFSLKDEHAQLRCALFRNQASALAFRPENGQLVQARGRVTIYEAQGSFQMVVETMEEAGAGRLQAAFEALKHKLEEEGLFETGRKKPLPPFPARVAVITSPGGAVIRDVIDVLRRRWPLAILRLHPVAVQGDAAVPGIVKALNQANRHDWAEVILLCRGGGSLEDLHAFNDERVARAVFASSIPVVSAVGHETDFSICDFVADLRAATPSAAAELIGPDIRVLQRQFDAAAGSLARHMAGIIQRLAQAHDQRVARLMRQHPRQRLAEQARGLAQFESRLARLGRALVPLRSERVHSLTQRVHASGQGLVPVRQRHLAGLARTLNAVSPLPTLARGYAVLRDAEHGGVLSSVAVIRSGQQLAAQLADGRVYARVDRTSKETLEPPTESGN